jgi:hypothetical protein
VHPARSTMRRTGRSTRRRCRQQLALGREAATTVVAHQGENLGRGAITPRGVAAVAAPVVFGRCAEAAHGSPKLTQLFESLPAQLFPPVALH